MAPRAAIPIAPAGPLPWRNPPIRPGDGHLLHETTPVGPVLASVRHSDVVISHGTAFNGRGYRVCGVRNKRGALCGRIGICPFHPRMEETATPDMNYEQKHTQGGHCTAAIPPIHSNISPSGRGACADSTPSVPSPASAVENTPIVPAGVRRLPSAPQRSRFKRSWTKEEHSLFLVALARHGRGKWKEIAADVGSRNGSQCQSHACKYFKRQSKRDDERKKASIHDMTEPVVGQEAATASRTDGGEDASKDLTASSMEANEHVEPVAAAHAGRESASRRSLREDAQLLLAGHHRGASVVVARNGLPDVPVLPASSPEPRISVLIRVNGIPYGGERLLLPDSMCREKFLADAAAKLAVGYSFTRIFTRGGTEIESLDSVLEAEELWLSSGEEFVYDFACSKSGDVYDHDGDDHPVDDCMNARMNDGLDMDGVMKGRDDALADEERISVTVFLNGTSTDAASMVLPVSMCLAEFLEVVAATFSVSSTLTRLFTRSGVEIESLDEICEGEHVWASDGVDFSSGA